MQRIFGIVSLALAFLIAGCQTQTRSNGESVLPDSEVVSPLSYYQGIDSRLTGSELKAALHELIDDHTQYPYTSSRPDTWDALIEIDAAAGLPGFVQTLYTRELLRSDQHNSGSDQWNREHVWAKSRGDFGTSLGAGTDLHHLRVADSSVNSSRNNKSFMNGGELVYDLDGALRTQTLCRTDNDQWTFEPPDEVKGDIARMLLYMAVRYEGDSGEPDLELGDVLPGKDDKRPIHGHLNTLLEWHHADPVSEEERIRNERVQAWQGNRNPFIDHPEWAASIWLNAQ